MIRTVDERIIPRIATEAELLEIAEATIKEFGMTDKEDRQQIIDSVRDAWVSVWDDYQTGSPGYCGKIAVVIFDGGPEFTRTYTWPNDKCQEVKLDN